MAKAIGPRSISRLLHGSPDLEALRHRAAEYRAPAPVSCRSVPPALAPRVHILQEDGRLLLMADNNAVAQLLRFHAPRIAKELQASDWQIRVTRDTTPRPPVAAAPVRTGAAPVLPASAAACLRDAAAGIEDEGLRESLLRLANLAD